MTVPAGLCRRSSSFGGRVHLRRGTGFTGRSITPLRRLFSAAPAPRGDHRQDLLRVKNPPRGNSYAAVRIRLKNVFPGPYLRGVSMHCKSDASNHLKRLQFVHRHRSTSSTRG